MLLIEFSFLAMQIAAIPIGNKGFHIKSLKLTLDVYTAPGILGFFMALFNFVAIIIWFRETNVDIYEGQKPSAVDKGTFESYFVFIVLGLDVCVRYPEIYR